jgi:hypothetical protein
LPERRALTIFALLPGLLNKINIGMMQPENGIKSSRRH